MRFKTDLQFSPLRFFFFFLSLLFVHFKGTSQSISVGQSILEEAVRRMDIQDSSRLSQSVLIRPLHLPNVANYDSLMQVLTGLETPKRTTFMNGKGSVRLLPAYFQQQYNSHHAFGWNDGSLFPAKGYQFRASAGIAANFGILSIQLKPELVYAANPAFRGFSPNQPDSSWYHYYTFQNWIDMPERFGEKSFAKLLPGQSSIRFNYKGMSLGVSSENLWWGPGTRNALMMSNNAPGFYHISFNSTRPHKTFLGKFEWQLIAGTLENSGVLPPDTSRRLNGQPLYQPKKTANRYINAVVIDWQPKWIRGLNLGFARSFYQYSDNIRPNLNGYLPVLSAFFKGNAQDENEFGRDQLLSFFFRWVFPKEKAEIYGEWGRNDHSGNLSDFVQEPEHSRAYLLGLKKIIDLPGNRQLELFGEITQLETPGTKLVRALQPWYVHYQVRHGYTHKGQVLGAGIGPGSNSQTIGVNWYGTHLNKSGLSFDRVVRNNDFYYLAFTGRQLYDSHWVDLVLSGTKTWHRKRMLYTAHLSLLRSVNYQWNTDDNVNHFQAGFTLGYLF